MNAQLDASTRYGLTIKMFGSHPEPAFETPGRPVAVRRRARQAAVVLAGGHRESIVIFAETNRAKG